MYELRNWESIVLLYFEWHFLSLAEQKNVSLIFGFFFLKIQQYYVEYYVEEFKL